MYIATQIRGGDAREFFKHETLKYPPSLTKDGEMRSGDKADLLLSLRALSPDSSCTNADATCIEGSVVVNMTTPAKNQTCQDYCKDNFASQIDKYRQKYDTSHIDVIFDTYKADSLKAKTRRKRGKGIR